MLKYLTHIRDWYRDPFRNKPNWAEITILCLTIAIVLIYRGQLLEMHGAGQQTADLVTAANIQAGAATKIAGAGDRFSKSADQINDQTKIAVSEFQRIANAAENSVKSALEVARLEERPWVSATSDVAAMDIDKPLPATVNLVLLNSGRTFARAVQMTAYSRFSRIPSDTLPRESTEQVEKSVAVLAPNVPSINWVGSKNRTSNLKDIFSDSPITNDWYFFVWGRITYEDVFHPPGKHTTKFCFYRKLSESGIMIQCSMNNDAD